MRVTGIGHAGARIDTAAGSVLCDPWTSPAYFASWFPFPDNAHLDWDALGDVDYLYVSHLHRDHFDPELLRRHVNKDAKVLLPAFPTDELRDELTALGFHDFVAMPNTEPVDLDGLRVMVVALTSPTDGPIGDSALCLDDGQARLLNQNDARPGDLSALTGFGAFDLHLLQFSGAIWYPMAYDLPEDQKAAEGRHKRLRQTDRTFRYIDAVGAAHVIPYAGPPCFLDAPLRGENDEHDDDTNIFPDQTVFLAEMGRRGYDNGHLLLPGTVAELGGGTLTTQHAVPDDEVERIFTDKTAYLDAYAQRRAGELEAERAGWGADVDVLKEVRRWWRPLLRLADLICDGVGAPVRFDVGDDLSLVIDFPGRDVRRWDGEECRYGFRAPAELVETLVARREVDWVNSLFLSLRFTAWRQGPYNEFLYTFFKCLSAERLAYADGWFADQRDDGGSVVVDGVAMQRRCPHLKADLGRFGSVSDGVLSCAMHGWQWDATTGRCLTAEGYPLRLEESQEPVAAAAG